MTIRLLGVFAHPDDDAYTIGGTLLLHRGEIDLTVVFATSGGAGPISEPSAATRETLGDVREAEQRAYLDVIGYADARVEWLHHPDYYLPDVPLERLVDEIQAVLGAVRPHVVVTFGPDGLTSHHDHMQVGAAATEAFQRSRRADRGSGDGAFGRLYHVALARADVDDFYRGVREGGSDYGEEGKLFDVTGVPDALIAVRADLHRVRADKLAGILAHRTQLVELERIPEPQRQIYLDAECFVQRHPPVERVEKVRGDLFEDLECDRAEAAEDPRDAASKT
ncbi:MAG: PIG-L deacetylase family protein [Actinomycetota bacterium]